MTHDTAPSAPPAPRRKRRWLRRVIGFLVFLVLLAAVAPLALSIPFVRHWVAARASDALGQRVTIGGISASWWSPIEVRNLEVHNPPGWTGDPLLAVDRILVDVRWIPLLTGTVDARVEVDRPTVTLVRAADGRTNYDALEARAARKPSTRKPTPREATPPATAPSRRPRLDVTVRDGSISAHGGQGSAPGEPERVDGISLRLVTDPDGRLEGRAEAVARRASPGGGDAKVVAEATLDGAGEGPVTVVVPALDLARLTRTLGAVLHLDEVAGSFAAEARLALDRDGGVSGKASATAQGLSWRRGKQHAAVASLTLEATPTREGDGLRADILLALEGVRIVAGSTREPEFSEPSLRIAGVVRRDRGGDISFGDAAAPLSITGRVLSGHLSGSLRGASTDRPVADLVARLTLALSPTLGRLAGVLEAPDDDLRGTVTLDASLKGEGGVLDLRADARAQGLVVGGGGDSAPWTEPEATIAVAGRWDGPAKRLVLDRASVAAGALSASAAAGFSVRTDPSLALEGKASLEADLARLRSLRAVFPGLASVQGGTLRAEATASGTSGLDLAWSVKASNLAFSPGKLSSRGYLERTVEAEGRFERPEGGDSVVTLSRLRSAMAMLPEKTTVKVRLAPEGPAVEGAATLTVNLQAVAIAFDKAIGLRPDETITGRLDVTASGASTKASTTAEFRVAGREIVLPGARSPGSLDATARVRTDAKARTTTVESATIKGYGLDATGTVTLAEERGTTSVRSANAHLAGDLAAARALLGLALGLPPEATLAGTLDSRIEGQGEGGGVRLSGRTTVQNLRYTGARDPKTGRTPVLEEPSVVIDHGSIASDVVPGRVEIAGLSVAAGALSAQAGGSITRRGEDPVLDLSGSVTGDCARLSSHLRAVLGPDYADLQGEGPLRGRFSVAGSRADGGRDLRLDADLSFGGLSSGGLTVKKGRVVVQRPAPSQALTLTVTGTANDGSVRLDGTCDLGRNDSPWAAKAKLSGVDTSPLVTKQGLGRYLALVLPAIVPAEATTSVLSGRLDADIDLASEALSGPSASPTLTGRGQVLMNQGTVKDSTLFGGLAGGGGALSQLLKVAPGVGGTFAEWSKAVVFERLSSKFTIEREEIRLDPVELASQAMDLKFSGVVGFDGRMDLKVPLRLGGQAGQAIEPYLKDRTIPLRVRSAGGGKPKVTPELKVENLGKGLLDDVLRGLGK